MTKKLMGYIGKLWDYFAAVFSGDVTHYLIFPVSFRNQAFVVIRLIPVARDFFMHHWKVPRQSREKITTKC
jgi:hypothetical protein